MCVVLVVWIVDGVILTFHGHRHAPSDVVGIAWIRQWRRGRAEKHLIHTRPLGHAATDTSRQLSGRTVCVRECDIGQRLNAVAGYPSLQSSTGRMSRLGHKMQRLHVPIDERFPT